MSLYARRETGIRHIRQKLGDDAHYIETIRGVGYKFNDRQENRL